MATSFSSADPRSSGTADLGETSSPPSRRRQRRGLESGGSDGEELIGSPQGQSNKRHRPEPRPSPMVAPFRGSPSTGPVMSPSALMRRLALATSPLLRPSTTSFTTSSPSVSWDVALTPLALPLFPAPTEEERSEGANTPYRSHLVPASPRGLYPPTVLYSIVRPETTRLQDYIPGDWGRSSWPTQQVPSQSDQLAIHLPPSGLNSIVREGTPGLSEAYTRLLLNLLEATEDNNSFPQRESGLSTHDNLFASSVMELERYRTRPSARGISQIPLYNGTIPLDLLELG